MPDRIAPYSLNAEESLIGGLLNDNSDFSNILELLNGEEFHKDSHRLIYKAMCDLFGKGDPADLVTVCDLLSSRNQLEAVGGASYIASLTQHMACSANLSAYAVIIADKAQSRRLIQSANEILSACYGGKRSEEAAEAAEAAIFGITGKRIHRRFSHIREIVGENIEAFQERRQNQGFVGIPSGFDDLDELTGGFRKSDLVILAGRPSMGKTALALCIARNAARQKFGIGFFSLEMSKHQIGERLLCMEAAVDSMAVRSGMLPYQSAGKYVAAAAPVGELPILIDDTPALSPLELRAKARRMAAATRLNLIIVDYLQLMRGQSRERREQEVSEISRSLKGLAKEMDVPVIALSQLSREVEKRNNKRPIMSDLRESGALEQDADLILFIYRDEVYDRNSKDRGIAEIDIAKQRNGPTSLVRLAYINIYARFESLAFRNDRTRGEDRNWRVD